MMMKKLILSLAALMAVSGAVAKSPKRGVCHNDFNNVEGLEILKPGVSWYYSWGTVPQPETDYETYKGIEFVPMVWKSLTDEGEKNIREWCKNHPETKYLLGYNEPNFKAQSSLTPTQAAEGWPRVQKLAKELGLQLVAPALNYSPDAPYQDPLKWMDEFVALVGADAFDFTAVHAYGGAGVTQKIATDFHNKYGKPVWLTEFCYWPGESGTQSADTQIRFMQSIVGWLETTPWIYRYAWFMTTAGRNSKVNFQLIEPRFNSSLDLEGYDLTRQGNYYIHLPGDNRENVMATGKWYPANYCVGYESLEWSEPVEGSAYDAPLDIVTFNTGGFADYVVNTAKSTDYYIGLEVSGYGEPDRFNPTLSYYEVNADMQETELVKDHTFGLPNSDSGKATEYVKVNLSAGSHRIRVKSTGMPSGIIVKNIIVAEAAGIDGIATDAVAAPVEYFNLQGMRVAEPQPGQLLLCRQGGSMEKVVF